MRLGRRDDKKTRETSPIEGDRGWRTRRVNTSVPGLSDVSSSSIAGAGQSRLRSAAAADGAAVSEDALVLGSTEHARHLRLEDQRILRNKTITCGVVLVLVFLLGLCFSSTNYSFYSPVEVLSCYGAWFTQTFGSLAGNALTQTELVTAYPHYYDITSQFAVMAITVLCGVLLSLAGCLYQLAFRNPIAAPTMLGVSNGIRVGLMVLVLQYGVTAEVLTKQRYVYAYIGAVVVLMLVFALTKLTVGRKKQINVVDMLLVGSLLSQGLGTVVTYINNYVFSDTDIQTYQNISEVLQVNTEPISYFMLALACAISIVPVLVLNFRFNILSFEDEEARLMGVDPRRLRFVALFCGTIMIIAAQIHVGMVSMVALVVPHVSRYLFGAEFRKQFWGNIFIGATLMVVARTIVSAVPFVGYGLPIGTIVNFLVMPVFVWMLAIQQRSWE